MSADPGATPVAARALAPDLARGGMLLLIALANVHYYLYDRRARSARLPGAAGGADRLVALVQLSLVDGRAYPLFGFLFGYGSDSWPGGARRSAGRPAAVIRLVRRRGGWMIVIGLVHGVLLWPGDIVGAYGLLALLMAGLLVVAANARLLAPCGRRAVVRSHPSTRSRPAGARQPSALLASMEIATRRRRWPSGPSNGSAWACWSSRSECSPPSRSAPGRPAGACSTSRRGIARGCAGWRSAGSWPRCWAGCRWR